MYKLLYEYNLTQSVHLHVSERGLSINNKSETKIFQRPSVNDEVSDGNGGWYCKAFL